MPALTRLETKPGVFAITDPAWPTYTPIPINPVVTSDTFASGSGELNGRTTDCLLGGTPQTWSVETGQYTAGSGVLTRSGSSTGAAILTPTSADQEITAKIGTLLTSGNAWLDARRTGTTSYRAQIGSGGSLALQVRFSSTTTTVASGFTAAAGDRIGIRVVGSTVQLLKNGVVLATVTDTQITAIGTCQLVATSTTVAGVWDDVIVRTINYPEAA